MSTDQLREMTEHQMIGYARRMRQRAEVAETEVAVLREIVTALDRWIAEPEHFWGSTWDSGLDIGKALDAYHQRYGPTA